MSDAAPDEKTIIKLLYWRLVVTRMLAMPNVYVFGGNESDLLTVTKSGYTDEYEVKRTRPDFLADRKKPRFEHYQAITPWHRTPGDCSVGRHGHGERAPCTWVRLSTIASLYPNRFWYVTPAGLLKPEDLPPFAGLIELSGAQGVKQVVQAPRLHREKASRHVIGKLHTAAYHRYTQLWTGESDEKDIRG